MLFQCPECKIEFESVSTEQILCPNEKCRHSWIQEEKQSEKKHNVLHYLILIEDSEEITIPIVKDEFTVGKSENCNLCLANANLKELHFTLKRKGDFLVLHPVQDSIVSVNKMNVTERTLLSSDVIEIDNLKFKYFVKMLDEIRDLSDMKMIYALDTEGRLKRHKIVRQGEEVADRIVLNKTELTIGSDDANDITIYNPLVSSHHAKIKLEEGKWIITDLDSTNGTFVNNELITKRALEKGDRIAIGPCFFIFTGETLEKFSGIGEKDVYAWNVGRQIEDEWIVKGISLASLPNEFVGIIGPSGAGKTILLKILAGVNAPETGKVFIGGENFYDNLSRLRRQIGYVPQQDIIYNELTVYKTLYYTAKLRLPRDLRKKEIRELISEVIKTLGLEEQRNTPVRYLSGGQRKRLNLGVELVTKPSVLFLDEPTSGLDPGTESKMMILFRQLADQGRTVFLTTHIMQHINLFDTILVIVKGRMAYYGPPRVALSYFGISNFNLLYEKLNEKSAEEWEILYKNSQLFKNYVERRIAIRRSETDMKLVRAISSTLSISEKPKKNIIKSFVNSLNNIHQAIAPHTGNFILDILLFPLFPIFFLFRKILTLRQFYFLSMRYLEITLADRRNVLILLAQAPIIAFLVTAVFETSTAFARAMKIFLVTLTAIWFGCINSAKEIVKELPIYQRERMFNLRLFAYVFSKYFVLSILCAIQSLILLVVVKFWENLEGSFWQQYLILYLTSVASLGIGLSVSALVNTVDKALSLIPILLIPQILFANAVVKLTGITEIFGKLTFSYWSFNAFMESINFKRVESLKYDISIIGAYVIVMIVLTLWLVKFKDYE